MNMSVEYPLAKGKKVTVTGRTEEGTIIDPGKNVGTVYCVGIHFESTGEVVYYEQQSVKPVG